MGRPRKYVTPEELEIRRLKHNRYMRVYYAQQQERRGRKIVARKEPIVVVEKEVDEAPSPHYRPRFLAGKKNEPRRCLYCHKEIKGGPYRGYCNKSHYLAAFREYMKPLASRCEAAGWHKERAKEK
jgi:hypothetical protein